MPSSVTWVTSHVRTLAKGESVHNTATWSGLVESRLTRAWYSRLSLTDKGLFPTSLCNLQRGPDCYHDGLSYKPLVSMSYVNQLLDYFLNYRSVTKDGDALAAFNGARHLHSAQYLLAYLCCTLLYKYLPGNCSRNRTILEFLLLQFL